jgi:RNA polymerase sigma-70 factor, ECF subfamily
MEHHPQEQAFIDAFEQYSDELFRHALLRLSDREKALDTVQECFTRGWEYVAREQEVERWRPFLYRILNNLVIDEYRKRKTQSLDALLEENPERAVAVEGELLRDDVDALEAAIVRFDSERAINALSELPESYRVVIVLRYVDGFSPGEIAEHLGESENAVSVRIHRALKKLRDLVSP